VKFPAQEHVALALHVPWPLHVPSEVHTNGILINDRREKGRTSRRKERERGERIYTLACRTIMICGAISTIGTCESIVADTQATYVARSKRTASCARIANCKLNYILFSLSFAFLHLSLPLFPSSQAHSPLSSPLSSLLSLLSSLPSPLHTDITSWRIEISIIASFTESAVE
jgi:hypothetical protein